MAIKSFNSGYDMLDKNTKSPENEVSDEHQFRCGACEITILAHVQAQSLLCCKSAALMMIETHRDIL